jgi:hypothetical protein
MIETIGFVPQTGIPSSIMHGFGGFTHLPNEVVTALSQD